MPRPTPSRSRDPAPRITPGLGRGLTDIISQGARPNTPAAPSTAATGVRQLSLEQIIPNPRQPRVRFVEEPLDELVQSIREHGILQPITVRPLGSQFEIIAGERRYRASKRAGLASIPVIVKQASDEEAYELALIENLQREDLDPIEEARGYRNLSSDFSLTQEQIARKVGKNRATVANALRLLDLPESVQSYVSQGRLSPGHAKAILGIPGVEQQSKLAELVIRQGLNVRQTEALVSRSSSSSPRTSKARTGSDLAATPAHLRALQEALQQKLAMKVDIRPSGDGGRVEIHYYNPSDLDRLLECLGIQL